MRWSTPKRRKCFPCVDLTERGIVQVSMNMTDYTKTSLYQSYEMVKMEAKRYGVNVVGTEIVGLTPMAA